MNIEEGFNLEFSNGIGFINVELYQPPIPFLTEETVIGILTCCLLVLIPFLIGWCYYRRYKNRIIFSRKRQKDPLKDYLIEITEKHPKRGLFSKAK